MKLITPLFLVLLAWFACIPNYAQDGSQGASKPEEQKMPNMNDPEVRKKWLDLLNNEVTQNPRDYRAYYGRAGILFNERKYREALVDAQRADDLQPHDANIKGMLAQIMLALDRFSDSLVFYNEAIKLDPQKAFMYSNRGAVCIKLRRFAEAQADSLRAIQMDPKQETAYECMGEILYAYRKYNDSISYCNQAIKLDPADCDAYFYRGCSYEKLGNTAQGAADKSKAVKMGYTGRIRWKTTE